MRRENLATKKQFVHKLKEKQTPLLVVLLVRGETKKKRTTLTQALVFLRSGKFSKGFSRSNGFEA